MRKRGIHPVPFDGAGNAADKNDRPIRFLPFDDADVGQGIIDDAVSVVIPGIVEEDKIAGSYHRSFVKPAIAADVVVDQSDPVGLGVTSITVVEIDTVLQKNGAGDTGTVIRNPSAIGLNDATPHQFGRCLYDGGSF